MKALLLAFALAAGLLLTARCPATVAAGESARVTFVVHCYDVGGDTLADRPGILRVERGFRGGEEVNRVLYDPQQVTVPQMEDWLRAADTYVRTLPVTDRKAGKETPR